MMQRIINDPDQVVEDSLKGYLSAYPQYITATDNPRVVKNSQLTPGKVGVITGGGSGHEPAFLGYVGRNLLDAVAVGEIFSSPTAISFLDAAKAADSGKGVACLYGNYAGDNMNVKMACKMAEKQGITIKTVIANDDVPSAPPTDLEKRRGVAGEILMWKVAGAAAERGDDLDSVIELAQHAIDSTRSIGIGLSPCVIPAVGKPNFHIEPGKMEVGIGHHGEPGIDVSDLVPAAQMAKIMTDAVVNDLPFSSGDDVVVLISGLGATPNNELHILYYEVATLLEQQGIRIHRQYVGNYFTSLEMHGATLTVMKADERLKQLIDAPAHSIGFHQEG
ncbi:dihydroxyacetone kinase [Vibrio nigripulchritudo]|uniref:dihydroxyacetone kinase subunit DhaK n=1 Tax=Vibrio nigripulchritudo TaxID=28173 RepID=UPI001C78671D|nr:dihydroxyacetone kinase subunit DhaK [Vibrio nigripulchritudo]BCL70952.1 dihydroxyacetone kinase [Vibrio nigripulchritudo]BDU32308.1 dihydroxyacetone kinase [Vibrio nigripulchritudo]